MYDAFSSDYDRFVNWPSRLGYELPFIEGQLNALKTGQPGRAVRVLDSACGTGMHAIALAQRGFAVAGADLSAGMIERARANAASSNLSISFEPVGFGAQALVFARQALLPFDALLCLGNSLPHLLSAGDLAKALADFAACLRPGGLLLLQSRNFDAVMVHRERWMEPQSYRQDQNEWIFLRFYDYTPDGLIDFNILTLKRTAEGPWAQTVTTTRLRPLLQSELLTALTAAGFTSTASYGDMHAAPFDPAKSGNLIVTALKEKALRALKTTERMQN